MFFLIWKNIVCLCYLIMYLKLKIWFRIHIFDINVALSRVYLDSTCWGVGNRYRYGNIQFADPILPWCWMTCGLKNIGKVIEISDVLLTSKRSQTFRTRSVLVMTWSNSVFPPTHVMANTSTSFEAKAIIMAWASSTPVSTSINSLRLEAMMFLAEMALTERCKLCNSRSF